MSLRTIRAMLNKQLIAYIRQKKKAINFSLFKKGVAILGLLGPFITGGVMVVMKIAINLWVGPSQIWFTKRREKLKVNGNTGDASRRAKTELSKSILVTSKIKMNA